MTPSAGWEDSAPAVAGLGLDIGRNIEDLVLGQRADERRHLIEAIGDLGHDGAFVVVVVLSEVGLQVALLEGVLGIHNIATAGVTSSAIGRENLGAIHSIACKRGHGSCDQKEKCSKDG